ncbi:MAG TPA: YggT family protein [Gaiellaceae bacterium]|jgi:YggT family protein|nr:YggT family protein [Gaiellaceae bacterium]
MGVSASLTLPVGDVVSSITTFIWAFSIVYSLTIIAYILTSWLRLPYSPTINRIQRFLYDVCEPYLRIFRRFLPSFGGLDLSPTVALIVLWVVSGIVIRLIATYA